VNLEMAVNPHGTGPDTGFRAEIPLRASAERVFDCVATLAGLRSWWTPIVAGSTAAGGRLVFGFEGLEEAVAMRVDDLKPATRVRWTCLEHTGAASWADTAISFDLSRCGPSECRLIFRHVGLTAEEVADGWHRFLASLSQLVHTGLGAPYRAEDSADALAVARAYHDAWHRRRIRSCTRTARL
jgi:uncharacterized protein YndB with AHSA1/START domain